MSGPIESMQRLPKMLRNAFRSEGFRLFGVGFAVDYLRFAVRAARRWGSTAPGAFSLLGFEVEYYNQSHAFFLLHEVFVNATYGFKSSERRPRVIDCGANVGMSVLFFKALYPDSEVVAIEPHPAAFSLLSRNVERNRLRGVRLINAAVAEADGELRLHFESGDAGSLTASVDPAWGGRSSQAVSAMRVSSLAGETVDFLKLDVEGAEYGVIRELIATGALANVRETVIEYHEIGSEPDQAAQLPKTLEGAGFQIDRCSFDAAARNGLLRARRRTR